MSIQHKNNSVLEPVEPKRPKQPFRIRAADGERVEIPAGEFYMNTKARLRRRMLNSLSSEVRQIDAAIEAGSMAYRQELAVVSEEGRRRPMAPADIVRATGLPKEAVRKGLRAWQDAGLGEVRSDDGGPLRSGHILIYSFASPRPAKREQGVSAHPPPNVFPTTCRALEAFAKRFKFQFPPGFEVARDSLPMLEEVARKLENTYQEAARALESLGAQPKKPRTNKEERKKDRTTSSSSKESAPPEPQPPTPSPVRAALEHYAAADDDAARQIVEACRANAPDATDEDIAGAIHDKMRVRRDAVKNPIGFLLTALPKVFEHWLPPPLPPAAAAAPTVSLDAQIAHLEMMLREMPNHPQAGEFRAELDYLRGHVPRMNGAGAGGT